MKILIVDDEREMTQLLKIELESEGYDVSVCHDGAVGLDLIRKINPDLVMLDVMMPQMDGYEVLKVLKEDALTHSIPVIMLTAKGLEDEIQKGLDLGADDYISKPFHSGLLLKRIESILNNEIKMIKKKILIIEDEKEMNDLLKIELIHQDYEVICAYDGEEGYAKYLSEHPDLIILDLMLPKCTGEEVCRRIRRERQDTTTAIVMLTAKGDAVDRIVGKVKGADTYMTKPFNSEHLLSEINKALDEKRGA